MLSQKSRAAESLQFKAMAGASRGLADSRFDYCMNSGIWLNKGMSAEQFCKQYAYQPLSLVAPNPAANVASQSKAASVGVQGLRAGMAPVSAPAFSMNPVLSKKVTAGRVKRSM